MWWAVSSVASKWPLQLLWVCASSIDGSVCVRGQRTELKADWELMWPQHRHHRVHLLGRSLWEWEKHFEMRWNEIPVRYKCLLKSCWCLWACIILVWIQREGKSPGSSSIVAVSMAPTEGNGPYSNPLKDEGYKRFKCTEAMGRTRQKNRQGMNGGALFHTSLSPHTERPALH